MHVINQGINNKELKHVKRENGNAENKANKANQANHFKRISIIFMSLGATPIFKRTSSF